MRVIRLGVWAFGIVLALELLERLVGGTPTDTGGLIRAHWVSLVVTQAQVLTFLVALYFLLLGWFRGKRAGLARPLGLALLLIVMIAGTELAIELMLRTPGSSPRFVRRELREYYSRHDRTIIQTLPECAVYDPDLLYILRPGECRFMNREFDTRVHVNRLGLRDDEQSLLAPEIVVLGDSYAMGWGVAQEETFAQLLEPVTGRTVLNAGVSSYGTAREVDLLSRIDRSRLAFLIIQYHETDAGENRAFWDGENAMPSPDEGRYQKAVTAAGLIRRYYPGKHVTKIGSALARRLLFAPLALFAGSPMTPADQPREAWLFLNALQNTGVELDGVEILVTELGVHRALERPFLSELREELQKPEFEELAQKIVVLDISDRIGPEEMFVLDKHINAAGHAAVADAIVEAVPAIGARDPAP